MRVKAATHLNRIRYSLYAPFYNVVEGFFRPARRRSIEVLGLKAGERVLLNGAGTGLDLDFLPRDVAISATDLTPAMITALRERVRRLGMQNVEARVMDAGALEFEDGAFDAVVLHLILAVVPDPVGCLREVERVLRPGGRAVVMDKFLPQERASWGRKLLNAGARLMATDINRKLEEIVAHTSLRVVHRENSLWGGQFIVALLEKPVVPTGTPTR